MPKSPESAHDVEARLAEVRERMAAALKGDDEALKVLDRVFPASWEDANLAVVWMLGNAARFGHAFAQNWLDRLVHPNGEPVDDDLGVWKRTASLAANDAAALRALVTEAYDEWGEEGHPTNEWRIKAEKLGAWPKTEIPT